MGHDACHNRPRDPKTQAHHLNAQPRCWLRVARRTCTSPAGAPTAVCSRLADLILITGWIQALAATPDGYTSAVAATAGGPQVGDVSCGPPKTGETSAHTDKYRRNGCTAQGNFVRGAGGAAVLTEAIARRRVGNKTASFLFTPRGGKSPGRPRTSRPFPCFPPSFLASKTGQKTSSCLLSGISGDLSAVRQAGNA